MVLLAAWMPFNNGLRPEPIIAVGSLITYVLIERSMRYSRMTPAALAVVTAAFTLGVQPTGLIAVAALIAGGRPILRILVRRHRLVGTWPLVAPMLAAGSVILTGGLRRPDPVNGVGGHQDSHRDRPQPGLVHREPAVLLPDPADRRRFAIPPVRLPDHCAVSVHCGVHHVAAQAYSRRGPWAGVAADGRHLRHHVLPDVHPHQMGAPLRPVRRGGRGDGRADHGAGVAVGAALVAQPDGVPGGADVRARAVLRHHQRLVVCVQLRRAVQHHDAENRRNHGQHNIFHTVRDHRAVCGVVALRAPRPRRRPDSRVR